MDNFKLTANTGVESSVEARERVKKARIFQQERFKESPKLFNAEMNSLETKAACEMDKKTEDFVLGAAEKMLLSARAYYRVLKVARTIADLRESEVVSPIDLAEALQYRMLK